MQTASSDSKEVTVHQRHIRAIVMEVFNSFNNMNPEYMWSCFTFKHVTGKDPCSGFQELILYVWLSTPSFSEHASYRTDYIPKFTENYNLSIELKIK